MCVNFEQFERGHRGRTVDCSGGADLREVADAAQKAVRDIVVGGQPYGLDVLPDGSLITILHRDNALVRVAPNGALTANVFLGSGGAYTIALPH